MSHRRTTIVIGLGLAAIFAFSAGTVVAGCSSSSTAGSPTGQASIAASVPSLVIVDPSAVASAGAYVQPGMKLVSGPSVLMDGSHVATLTVQPSQPSKGEYDVTLELDRQGAATLSELTKARVGKQLVLALNGIVIAAPEVREPIAIGVLGFAVDAQSAKLLLAAKRQ